MHGLRTRTLTQLIFISFFLLLISFAVHISATALHSISMRIFVNRSTVSCGKYTEFIHCKRRITCKNFRIYFFFFSFMRLRESSSKWKQRTRLWLFNLVRHLWETCTDVRCVRVLVSPWAQRWSTAHRTTTTAHAILYSLAAGVESTRCCPMQWHQMFLYCCVLLATDAAHVYI